MMNSPPKTTPDSPGDHAHLESQKTLADRGAMLATVWRTDASRALREAMRSRDPEERRRARAAPGTAVEVASEASGLAFRLENKLDRYRADLDELERR